MNSPNFRVQSSIPFFFFYFFSDERYRGVFQYFLCFCFIFHRPFVSLLLREKELKKKRNGFHNENYSVFLSHLCK